MPTPDFRDRALTAILEGGLRTIPWTKVITNTLAGSVSCLFQSAGMPEAGTYPGNALQANMIVPGMVSNILGGASRIVPPLYRNHLIQAEALNAIGNFDGVLLLADLLCTYRGLPANTGALQDLSTVGSAAGSSMLPRYSDGRGVRIFADVTTAFGATPVSLQISYTNELGVSGRVSTATTVASVPVGRSACVNPRDAFSLPLQSGDNGVRSLQAAQLSGTTGAAGVYTLFLYRPLMSFYIFPNFNNHGGFNLNGETQPPEILSGCNLILFWLPKWTNNSSIYGHVKTLKVNKGR